MKTKYYQLNEVSDEANSIGVVKMIRGIFDLEQIKSALQSHFDEEVSEIKVDYDLEGWDSSFRIYFKIEDRIEFIDAVETWLYF